MSEEKKRKRGRPPKRNKEETIRFTMDMPVDFHAQILDRIEESEQTIKKRSNRYLIVIFRLVFIVISKFP